MKHRKRRQDWPVLFFSSPHEKIIEINSFQNLSPSPLRARLLSTNLDSLSRDGSSANDSKDALLIQSSLDALPFLTGCLDGIIILYLPNMRGIGTTNDEDGLKTTLSELKRTLKRKGRVIIYLENRPLAIFSKKHPLKMVLKTILETGYELPEVFWPYRSLRNLRRLIPLSSTNAEKHFIQELTIHKRSEGSVLSSLKYFFFMILSELRIFRFLMPGSYLVTALN